MNWKKFENFSLALVWGFSFQIFYSGIRTNFYIYPPTVILVYATLTYASRYIRLHFVIITCYFVQQYVFESESKFAILHPCKILVQNSGTQPASIRCFGKLVVRRHIAVIKTNPQINEFRNGDRNRITFGKTSSYFSAPALTRVQFPWRPRTNKQRAALHNSRMMTMAKKNNNQPMIF